MYMCYTSWRAAKNRTKKKVEKQYQQKIQKMTIVYSAVQKSPTS